MRSPLYRSLSRLPSPLATPARQVSAAVVAVLYASRALAGGADGTADTDTTASESSLQEVVVTATRRASAAQDLPISITAVTGDSLDAAGVVDEAGLARSMAGVSYTDKGPFGGVAGANLIIRGLNSESTSGLPAAGSPVVPPVATYINETPLFVNLRLQDLDHVEVLRGPQGTLYGSGSLGGAIRFVQNSPDPQSFDAKVETSLSKTEHTHALNEDVKGMLNIPLSDTFAVRLNAGWTYDAGYINQPNLYALDATGVPIPAQPGNLFSAPTIYRQDGVNAYRYDDVRIAALWKPNEAFHAELAYYYQRSSADGFPYVATNPLGYTQPINPASLPVGNFTNPPALLQYYNEPFPAGVDRLSSPEYRPDTTLDTVDLAALTLSYDFGFATLTSASSWAHHDNNTAADETAEYLNFPSFPQDLYGQNPRMFILGLERYLDKPVSQEIRLASKSGGFFEWVGGFFFKHQETIIEENDYYPGYNDYYNACVPQFGASPADFATPSVCGVGDTAYVPGQNTVIGGVPIIKDQVFTSTFDTKANDYAAFGELTAHLTSAWSVTGGLRLFRQTVEQEQQSALSLLAAPQFGTPPTTNTTSNSYARLLGKFNMAYQINATNLVYGTWSQGFRRGGVNALPAVAGGVTTPPSIFKVQPDTVNNYELGFKGTLDNRLRYSLAVFDVQWHNIQELVQLTPIVIPGVLNIGDGFSRGVEFESDAAVTSHLTTHIGYTYDQTKLTSVSPLYVFPNVDGAPPSAGSVLPGTPKTSLIGGFEYGHMPLGIGELRYAINAHYQSSTRSALSSTIPDVPGFTMLDTRLSYTLPHVVISAYVENLTNNLGITSFQDPAVFGNRYLAIVSQPRTYGLTLSYSFKQ
jgi:iron complex outermembrane receptor protein